MKRTMLVLTVAVVMAVMLVAMAGSALAAEAYKGKGNAYGWIKNNGGVFTGGGNGGCGGLCE
jgi:hypothetical protein